LPSRHAPPLVVGGTPSPRAKYLALIEEGLFNESQILGSQRRRALRREPNVWLSLKSCSSPRAMASALGEELYSHSGWAPPSPRAVAFALSEEFLLFCFFFQQPQVFTQITYIITGIYNIHHRHIHSSHCPPMIRKSTNSSHSHELQVTMVQCKSQMSKCK
jgi:hypothetical protein